MTSAESGIFFVFVFFNGALLCADAAAKTTGDEAMSCGRRGPSVSVMADVDGTVDGETNPRLTGRYCLLCFCRLPLRCRAIAIAVAQIANRHTLRYDRKNERP